MRPDPCPGCFSRTRVEMAVQVMNNTAIVSVCWGCGYANGLVVMLDENGIETSDDYEYDALDDATALVMDLGPRLVWLRRCRDIACLRWS